LKHVFNGAFSHLWRSGYGRQRHRTEGQIQQTLVANNVYHPKIIRGIDLNTVDFQIPLNVYSYLKEIEDHKGELPRF
jgi:hypothetical protein